MSVKTTQDCALRLGVSEDRMRVTLESSGSPLAPPDFEDAVREQFRSLGLAPSSSVFNPNAWLANRGPEELDSTSTVLFEGLRPVAPQDGHVRWAGEFFKTGFVIDPDTDSVNYRQKAAQSVVEKGQLLAEIIAPAAGTDQRRFASD